MNWNDKIKSAIDDKNYVLIDENTDLKTVPTKALELHMDRKEPGWRDRPRLTQDEIIDILIERDKE